MGLHPKSKFVLLLAVLLCCDHTQRAAARLMGSLSVDHAGVASHPARQTATAAAVPAPAAEDPMPAQHPVLQATKAAGYAVQLPSSNSAQARVLTGAQATAAAQGRVQTGPLHPDSAAATERAAAAAPPTAAVAAAANAAAAAAAKREAWKAAFRARQKAAKAARGTAVVASIAAAAVQEGVTNAAAAAGKSHVADGLPEMIPIQLLLGDSKYTNPQLSPDNNHLAYVKPSPETGVANVFIRRLQSAPRPRTAFESARSPDSARVAREVSIFERDGTVGDRQITFDKNEGVSAYSWSEDGSSILYIQDANGDENYHLYLVPIATPGDTIDLTPFPGVKAQDIVSCELNPDKLYIGLNRRDPSVFDMYQLDMTTLTLSLHTINPGEVSNWLLDYDFNIRGAEGYDNNNGASYVVINDAMPLVAPEHRTLDYRNARLAAIRRAGPRKVPAQANFKPLEALFVRAEKEKWGLEQWIAASSSKADVSKWRRHITWPFGEEGGVFKFNKAGDGLFVISSLGRDTTELQLISAAPGAKVLKRIASHPLTNINSVEFNPQTYEPQIVSFDYLKVQWTVLDPSIKQEWALLESFRPAEEVTIVERSHDDKVWIVAYTSDSVNTKYYIHRRGTWPPELLLDTQPDLLDYSVSKTHPVVIEARDGVRLPSYLTLPVSKQVPLALPKCVEGPVPDLSGKGRVDVAALRVEQSSQTCSMGLDLPLVLLVHGGPWARDTWGVDPVVQLLTNRGYAVLQVNYRASSGYGKKFMNLGNNQWGVGTMQHDLTDSVKWAIEKGIADPKKICISGGSYGGYATLAGLAFTPDLYACGLDLVGISNVGTFMKSIPPYWKPLRYEWTERVGPADVEEPFNRRISPMYHVDKIKAPLMIAQGAHDPRVPQAESDQMFRAMYTNKRDVQYVLYTDEGHGISKPSNRMDYYSRVEQFLAKYLGGRAAAPLKLEGVSAIDVRNLEDLAKVADSAKKEDATDALVSAQSKSKPPLPNLKGAPKG